MSATSSRAARRERQAAAACGSTRAARCGRATPDVAPFQARGHWFVAESKSRGAYPVFIERGLAQAQRYAKHATPVLVLFARGKAGGLAVVALDVLSELLGVAIPKTRPTANKKPSKQLAIPGCT